VGDAGGRVGQRPQAQAPPHPHPAEPPLLEDPVSPEINEMSRFTWAFPQDGQAGPGSE
jgi:hypothetical protein